MRLLGDLARLQGRPQDAEEHYNAAMELYKRSNKTSGVAHCNCDLGLVQQQCGQFGEARKLLDIARSQFQAVGSIRGVGNCLRSLAGIDIKEGEVEVGRSKLREAC